eukprot:SAG11_NODE_142_length_14906_cov_8.352333_2_plen_134_part_00
MAHAIFCFHSRLPVFLDAFVGLNSLAHHVPYQTSIVKTGGNATAGMPGQVTVLKLAPGTHLRLHTGPKNQRLTLHLGLTVPVGPTIRVGAEPGEVREWEEGKVIAFDDSFVHEVRARPLEPSSTHPPSCDEYT